MVRNLVLLSGSSHPQLMDQICAALGVPPSKIHLSKFSVGETRVEIGESVREKDVFIVQSGGGKVNDHLMELLITISACKTASAKRVTAVLPLFPYSRQSDLPYNKVGAPLARMPTKVGGPDDKYTFDTRPATPHFSESPGAIASNSPSWHKKVNGLNLRGQEGGNGENDQRNPHHKDTWESIHSETSVSCANNYFDASTQSGPTNHYDGHLTSNRTASSSNAAPPEFKPQRGYRQWVAQAGTLVADLLTAAGADHIITMDLHDPQYQGFFDIPVDNLYGRHLLRKYIQHNIVRHTPGGIDGCVIVSPDAGGAKRATNIADALGIHFALIHKERRPTQSLDRQNANLLLVGQVADRTAILVDDLADTSNTITRAAKLLKRSGAKHVFALVTHGVFSGDAVDRINASHLDKVVVTNSVPQSEHLARCHKLEVLEVGGVFAEAIRRVHHGESISCLFQFD